VGNVAELEDDVAVLALLRRIEPVDGAADRSTVTRWARAKISGMRWLT